MKSLISHGYSGQNEASADLTDARYLVCLLVMVRIGLNLYGHVLEYSQMTSSGSKAYRLAVYINLSLALLSLFFMPGIGNGILLSTVVYFLYLLALNHGIAKALQDASKASIIMVLLANIVLLGGLIVIGIFLDTLFSIVGVLFGLMSSKILYMIGAART